MLVPLDQASSSPFMNPFHPQGDRACNCLQCHASDLECYASSVAELDNPRHGLTLAPGRLPTNGQVPSTHNYAGWSTSHIGMHNRQPYQYGPVNSSNAFSYPTRHMSIVPYPSQRSSTDSPSDAGTLVSPSAMAPPSSCLEQQDSSDAEDSHSPGQLSVGSSVFSSSSATVKKEGSPKTSASAFQGSSGLFDPTASSSRYGTATTISNADFPGAHMCNNGKEMKFPELKHDHDIFCDGERIAPDIQARIEKNVFYQDDVWTCYRRNYISLQCSYTLTPTKVGSRLYLYPDNDSARAQIRSLGVCLSASMDEGSGKSIPLVQHTAKRDHGTKSEVMIHKLAPSTGPAPQYQGTTSSNGFNLPDQFKLEAGQDDTEHNANVPPAAQHTFERIQFKQATQNNGRRRAQQQYYHLTVELHAQIRKPSSSDLKWVRIAHRVSEKMVVRGRSPGHYKPNGDGSRPSGGSPGSSGEGLGPRGFGFGDSGGQTSAGFRGGLPLLGSSSGAAGHGSSTNHAASLLGNGMPAYLTDNTAPSLGAGPLYGPFTAPYRSHSCMSALPSPTHSHSASSTSLSSMAGSVDAQAGSFPSDIMMSDHDILAVDNDDEYNKIYSNPGFTNSSLASQHSGQYVNGAGAKHDSHHGRLQSPSVLLGSNSGSPAPLACGRESFNPYRTSFSSANPSWAMGPYGVSRYSGLEAGHPITYGSEGLGAGF